MQVNLQAAPQFAVDAPIVPPFEQKNKFARLIPSENVIALGLNISALALYTTSLSVPLLTVGVLVSMVYAAVQRRKASHALAAGSSSAAQLVSRVAIVNVVGWSGLNMFIHESGHYIAAKALFQQARPQIWIKPFQGAGTSYTASSRLTYLGRFLGKTGAMSVVAIAGLAASTLCVCSELAAAQRLRRSHPKLSAYVSLHAICHIFHEVVYGLTVFLASKKDLTHDLVRVWRLAGVHPLIPVILMIALPRLTWQSLSPTAGTCL